MPTAINIDVMLARRKMSVTELAQKVDITIANISILKNSKAKAIRLPTLQAICRLSNASLETFWNTKIRRSPIGNLRTKAARHYHMPAGVRALAYLSYTAVSCTRCTGVGSPDDADLVRLVFFPNSRAKASGGKSF